MLDGFCEAFARFLGNGRRDALAPYLDDGAEPAFLDVYRNGFVKTCTDVLHASYPSVAQLVGEDCFKSLARRYVDTHPPHSASLAEYGEAFAEVIEETRELHGLAYLGCIARLDRAWTEVYFAAETPHGEGAASHALAALDEDAIAGARGRLAGSAHLLSLEFSVLDAWAQLRSGELRTSTSIAHEPLVALLWRRDEEILFRALGAPEHAFVAGIAAGKTFSEAALEALERDPDFDVSTAFASLLAQYIVTVDSNRAHAGPHGGLP